MADGDLVQIPTSPGTPFPLGRSIVWHDPRNRQHRALTAAPRGTPRTQPWGRTVPSFNQGDHPDCTTEAAVGLMVTQPHTRAFTEHGYSTLDAESERVSFYRQSQQYDPWPGPPPAYDGTSTDAPFKLLRARGLIGGWKWLFGVEEVATYLQYSGPVVVGTLWLRSMFDVDRDGYVVVDRGSPVDGGHAYEVVQCTVQDRDFVIVNSWGSWGVKGRARVRFDDMGWLLSQQGEAVTVP